MAHACANAIQYMSPQDKNIDPVWLYKEIQKIDNDDDPNDGIMVGHMMKWLRTNKFSYFKTTSNPNTIFAWLKKGVPVVLSIKSSLIKTVPETAKQPNHAILVYAGKKSKGVFTFYFVNSWKSLPHGSFEYNKELVRYGLIIRR